MALPPSWTALSSLRALLLDGPGLLDAASALHPLGSWTQLTSLHCINEDFPCRARGLEQQLPRLSALQHLAVRIARDFELPPGRWQGQLTSLVCDLEYVLSADASPASTAAVVAHATALRQLVFTMYCDEPAPAQPQLLALLGALPALERVRVADDVEPAVQEAHTALGSPLGARLGFSRSLRS